MILTNLKRLVAAAFVVAMTPGGALAVLPAPIAPFPACPNLGYMFASATGAQSTYNYFDISTATLVPIKDLTLGATPIVVNAAGYSNTQHVFWAVRALQNPPQAGVGPFPDEIVRIDSVGNVDSIGAPVNLAALGYPDFLALAGTVVGDVMYVHTKLPANHLFAIDVNPTSATLGTIIADHALSRMSPGNPDSTLNIGDWDFSTVDGQLYGLELAGGQRKMIKVDPANGTVTDVSDLSTNLPASDNYGAVFMEDGRPTIYVAANNMTGSGQSQTFMVRMALTPPLVDDFAMGAPLRINDGADCLLATDFGDAPDSYLTASQSGGPGHVMSQVFNAGHRFYLGALIDSDIDGFPSTSADTDDLNVPDINDEDAVPPGTVLNANGPRLTVPVTNNTGQPGLVAGWLDVDGDGTFSATERATAPAPAQDGQVTLTWPVTEGYGRPRPAGHGPRPVVGAAPADTDLTANVARIGPTLLRLRLYADPAVDATPGGWVDGGELEDHMVTLANLGPAPAVFEQPVVWTGGDNPGGTLPRTGSSVVSAVALGVTLVIVGALILVGTRIIRRREWHHG